MKIQLKLNATPVVYVKDVLPALLRKPFCKKCSFEMTI